MPALLPIAAVNCQTHKLVKVWHQRRAGSSGMILQVDPSYEQMKVSFGCSLKVGNYMVKSDNSIHKQH